MRKTYIDNIRWITVLRWCICGIGGKKNVRGKLDGIEKA